MKIDKRILKEILKFQIDLNRLSVAQRTKVVNVFKKAYKEIKNVSDADIVQLSARKRESIIKEIGDVAGKALVDIADELRDSILPSIAELQFKATDKLFASLNIGLATGTLAESLIKDPFVNGNPLAAHWDKLSQTTQFNLSAAVRTGVVTGESNTQMFRRIREALDISQRSAMTLINTAVHNVGNSARDAVHAANQDIIKNVVWLTALDSHVCELCIGRSGLSWKNNDNHTPDGHSIPFQVPPIHPNDRCVLVPVVDSELLPPLTAGERASSFGPVKGDITFKEFLDMLPENEVEDMLGVGKAQLYRDGKITLRDLLDNSGEVVTLEKLLKKYS